VILPSILHRHKTPYQQINFVSTYAAQPKYCPSPEQLQGITSWNQSYHAGHMQTRNQAQHIILINPADSSMTSEVPLDAYADELLNSDCDVAWGKELDVNAGPLGL
jgi:hypothetical protein